VTLGDVAACDPTVKLTISVLLAKMPINGVPVREGRRGRGGDGGESKGRGEGVMQ
jgi:hypothetical protein